MKKEYFGKTPEQILEMMTLKEKAGQVISSGFCCYEEVERGMELGFGCMSALWGKKRPDLKRFQADAKKTQELSPIPMLIGMDMETGLGQIVLEEDLATEFPDQMALGAIANRKDAERLAYLEGKVIQSEAVKLGWNVTFGPVVDVNVNPANPITNVRSIGEDPEHVAQITGAFINGLQEGDNFLACAKHFPGAGMQSSDSHFELEKTKASREEMDNIHLYTFKKAIENNVAAFMCNHAIYPMFDTENVATTSKSIMLDLLRDEMGFEGFMITDAMGMAGLTKQDGNKHMGSIRAIEAGCDILYSPYDVWEAPAAIAKAVEDGILTEERLNAAVLHVLRAKKRLGLFDGKKPETEKMNGWAISTEIAEKSVTLIRDRNKLIPTNFTKTENVLVIEPTHPGRFLDYGLYTNMTLIAETIKKDVPQAELALIPQDVSAEKEQELLDASTKADIVIVGTSFRSHSGQVGLLTEQQINVVNKIVKTGKKVIAVISNPYVAAQLPFVGTVICCYSTSKVSVQAATDVITGKLTPIGKLPVTIPDMLNSNVTIVDHG